MNADQSPTRKIPGTATEVCVVPFPGEKGQQWTLRFKQGSAGHIIKTHVKKVTEPWHEVLGSQYCTRLRATPDRDRTADDLTEFKALLFDQARASCNRPMVLHCREKDVSVNDGPEVTCWILLCPAGVQIAIRESRDGDHLIHTAFLAESTIRRQPGSRWRMVVDDVIRKYCYYEDARQFWSEGLPPREIRHPDTGRTVLRSIIKFVTFEKWGFVAQKERYCYTFQLPEWQAATDFQGKQPAATSGVEGRAPMLKSKRHRGSSP